MKKNIIGEIYDCTVLWRSDDADHPNTPPKSWQKVLPLIEAAPALWELKKLIESELKKGERELAKIKRRNDIGGDPSIDIFEEEHQEGWVDCLKYLTTITKGII